MAGFGDQAVPLPNSCQVPLFILRSLQQKGIQIPAGCVFMDGLEESSISFWMHVLENTIEEAEGTLNLVLKHGDVKCAHLASVFYKSVGAMGLNRSEAEVFRAMLIRFRFSPICNGHVVQNYEGMIAELSKLYYHDTCALLDCGQYQLVNQYNFEPSSRVNCEALVDKLCRRGDENARLFLSKIIKQHHNVPKLLKGLIQRKASGATIQLVWDSVQATIKPLSVQDFGCFPPLAVLSRLLLEHDISVDTIQSALDVLDESLGHFIMVSKKALALHTALFWEAPEEIINHFLDLVPSDYELDHNLIFETLRLTKYSDELCHRLIDHLEPVAWMVWDQIKEFRPDLVKGIGPPNRH